MTLTEFLAWEERQELRYELDGFQSVAMTDGTLRHDRITFCLRRAVDRALRGTPCRPAGPDVEDPHRRRARPLPGRPDRLPRPSPPGPPSSRTRWWCSRSSARARPAQDRILKLREYQAVPSILRYVILEPGAVAATAFERRGTDSIVQALTETDRLAMPEAGIEMPLAEIVRRGSRSARRRESRSHRPIPGSGASSGGHPIPGCRWGPPVRRSPRPAARGRG